MLMLVMRHFDHPLALPLAMAVPPALFWAALQVNGWTIEQAWDQGWAMAPPPGSSKVQDLWKMYNIDLSRGFPAALSQGIHWPAVLAQVKRGLRVVVFGVSASRSFARLLNWLPLLFQMPSVLALFMVICFGSCMDVAAIQVGLRLRDCWPYLTIIWRSISRSSGHLSQADRLQQATHHHRHL